MLERSGMGVTRYEEIVGRLERVANYHLDTAEAEAGDAAAGRSLISSKVLTMDIEEFLKAYRMIFFWGRTDLLHKNLSAYRLHVTMNLSEKEKEKERRRSSTGGGEGVRVLFIYLNIFFLPCLICLLCGTNLSYTNNHHTCTL
jgi:hypothetical protein